MNTKKSSVRSFLPLLLAGLALLLLGTGCFTPPTQRLYTVTQAPDGKWYDPNGNRSYPMPASVKVENTLATPLEVFAREDLVIAVVPPGEIRTIYVNMTYIEPGFRMVLFARPVGDSLRGKELAKREFRFSNYYGYDQVYGPGWGSPVVETKVWTVGTGEFILRPQAPSRVGVWTWF